MKTVAGRTKATPAAVVNNIVAVAASPVVGVVVGVVVPGAADPAGALPGDPARPRPGDRRRSPSTHGNG